MILSVASTLCWCVDGGGHMSSSKKKKMLLQMKEERQYERNTFRAERSAKKVMYHPIAPTWATTGIRCESPLSVSDDFVVALASDDADPVPIFAAINSTLTNTRRRQLDFVAFVSRDCAPKLKALVRNHILSYPDDSHLPKAMRRAAVLRGAGDAPRKCSRVSVSKTETMVSS